MADARKIEIEILGGTTSSGGQGEGGSKKTVTEPDPNEILARDLQQIFHPIKSWEYGLAQNHKYVYGGLQLAKQAGSIVESAIFMEHNRYFTLKEDYIGQNRMNVVRGEISNMGNILGAAAGGAIAGAKTAGIPGAVIGAIVGGGFSIGQMHIQKQQKIEQYQMQLNTVNMETTFAESRASLINGGHGTEN